MRNFQYILDLDLQNERQQRTLITLTMLMLKRHHSAILKRFRVWSLFPQKPFRPPYTPCHHPAIAGKSSGKCVTNFFSHQKPHPKPPPKAGFGWEEEKGKKQVIPLKLDQAKPFFWASISSLSFLVGSFQIVVIMTKTLA